MALELAAASAGSAAIADAGISTISVPATSSGAICPSHRSSASTRASHDAAGSAGAGVAAGSGVATGAGSATAAGSAASAGSATAAGAGATVRLGPVVLAPPLHATIVATTIAPPAALRDVPARGGDGDIVRQCATGRVGVKVVTSRRANIPHVHDAAIHHTDSTSAWCFACEGPEHSIAALAIVERAEQRWIAGKAA
jgi:hypothetical protein